MKIFVFTDIHGSLNCLSALLKTKDYIEADKRIFLGDVVFGCSRPNECIDILDKEDIICILGNNDSYIADHIPDIDWSEFDNSKKVQLQWMTTHILNRNKAIMKNWQKDLLLDINNVKFYFTHYPWENYNNDTNVIDIPIQINLDAREQMFKDIDANYYIFGHEHKSNHFESNNKHYYCIGSSSLKCPGSYLIIN